MGIHILFIVLYYLLSGILPAEVICGIFTVHCVLAVLRDISNKEKLHLMYVFYTGSIIGALANLSYIYKIHTFGVSETSMYRYVSPEHVSDGILIWAIGNSCIFLGYEMFKKSSFASIAINIPRDMPRKAFYVILTLLIIQFTSLIAILRMLTGGVLILIWVSAIFGIMFYARLWALERNNTYRNYAIILCLLQLWSALNTSFLRFELLTPFFSLFAGYFVGKGSLKYLLSYRIVPIFIFFAVFALFFGRLGGSRSHFIDAFTEERVEENQSYVYEDAEDDKGALFERSSNIAQLSNVVRLTERNGFYGGEVSAPILAAFVPRFLWPDKPQIQLGAWFAVEIGVARRDENGRANNSVNMTIPGNLYLDFGWLGVILGCTLFGGFIAALWNAAKFHSSPYNLTGTLWGGYLMLYSLFGIGADLQIVVSLISSYLSFFVLKKFVQPMFQRMGARKLMARAIGR